MNKAVAIILAIAILTLCGFCMAYGADFYGFRGAANNFVFVVAGPAVYSTLSGIAATIAANSWYQLLHPIMWMIAGGLVVTFVWKALKPHLPASIVKPAKVLAREEPRDVIITESPSPTRTVKEEKVTKTEPTT
jgi:hypothetical protein